MAFNPDKILGAECVFALGINAWGALRNGYVPWPPTLVRTLIAFAILNAVGEFVDEELADWLGAGFTLALIVREFNGNSNPKKGAIPNMFGAIPPAFDAKLFPYHTMAFGAKSAGNAPAGSSPNSAGTAPASSTTTTQPPSTTLYT